MPQPASKSVDVLIIGAGHNGLATGAFLARNGVRVLVLEKNDYVGGMAGSREILTGCRNDVGATCLFPLAKEVVEFYDFEAMGVEYIPLPVFATNLTGMSARPLMFQSHTGRQLWSILRDFGPGAVLGFVRMMKFFQYPAKVMNRFTARQAPHSLEDILASAPDEARREQLKLAFTGSAMDVMDRFFPDKAKHMELRANLAFAAIQSTYKGPYTPGSAMCLVFTMAQEGSEGLMKRVKGGIGRMSEALARQVEQNGGEIRLKQAVARILVEDGAAVGVELKNGSVIRARLIVSNLDKVATFDRLLSGYALPPETRRQIDSITHKGAFVHICFKLNALPPFAPRFAQLNRIPYAHFGGAMVFEPEEMQKCFEECQAGRLPPRIPIAYQFPTLMDDSLAPKGFHIATAYGFFYPCDAPKEKKGEIRDEIAEMVIRQMDEYFPGFRAAIVSKAVFASDHFAAMHWATNGDFTHGVIHPEQMLGNRTLVRGTGHATPVERLFLCGASCHPGPGVTFLPGYNCGNEVLAALKTLASSPEAAAGTQPRALGDQYRAAAAS
ncbi:MAG: NAD(P)/FAD-dependent oxidoreductase [Proteobacteria bacterium]|nr:NAD(P)/FAD-dependent oxidoreductase [Pseudomonadota bacterium]